MKHLPSNFRYSFSKIESFRHCPMSFYLTYIENPGDHDELPGYFSQFGQLMHSLLQEYFEGKLPSFLLASEWQSRYDSAVTVPAPAFPTGFGEKNYLAALDYLNNFTGLPDNLEVLTVEKKFVLNISGYQVSGIADLVLRNKETGGIIIWDHKTKSDNSIKKELQTYRKQLYLYAMWVKEEFGIWPESLAFNMVKSNRLIEETFDLAMVDITRDWILAGIKDIEAADIFELWSSNVSSYFCRQICGVNLSCNDYQVFRQAEYEKWLAKKQAEEMPYA